MATPRELFQNHRWLLPVTIIAITAALIYVLIALKPSPPESDAGEKTWPIQAQTLRATALSPELRLLGKLETPYQTQLTSTVTADVKALPALEGEAVKQGDAIIVLDDREAELVVRQRQADVEELASQIRQQKRQHQANQALLREERELVTIAERQLAREERLAESNLNSQAQLDQARQALQGARSALINRELAVDQHDARLQALQARLQRAEAALEQALIDRRKTQVQAPFDGIVSELRVSPGERVRPGEPLATLFSRDRIEVRAQIPMKHVSTLRQAIAEGTELHARSVNQNRVKLRLDRLSGTVNQGAGGVDGLFRVESPTTNLALNQTLELILTLPKRTNLFAVPISAIYDEDTIYRVIDNRLKPVSIEKVGRRYMGDEQRVLIKSPELAGGNTVLATQLPNAIEGLKVSIQNGSGDQ